MSDTNPAIHAAVASDLARRRELAQMTKPALISYIVQIERDLGAFDE